MEDFLINSVIPRNTHAENLDAEIELIDPAALQATEEAEAQKNAVQKNAARVIRAAPGNKARKYMCMQYLKKLYPDVSLRTFCEEYVKQHNEDTLEDYENNHVCDLVEADFLRGRVRRGARGRKRRRFTPRGRTLARRTRVKRIPGGAVRISGKGGQPIKKVRTSTGERISAASPEVLLKEKQRRKGRIARRMYVKGLSTKAARKAAKKTIRKARRKRVIKKTAGATVLAPLQPFRGMMIRALKTKGLNYSPKTPLVDIATAYYNKVVKPSNYEPLPDNWYEQDPMFYAPIEDVEEDYAIGAAITTIVGAIIGYIKEAKKKREAGAPLTAAEEITAVGAERFVKDMEARTGLTVKPTEPTVPPDMPGGEAPKAPPNLMLIVLGIVGALLVFKVLK